MIIAKTRSIVLVLAVLLLISSAIAGVYTQASKTQKERKTYPRTYQPAKVTTAPNVVSRIKGLEISGVNLINQGTPEAAVEIHVINTRDEAVMAVDFIAGKNADTSGIAIDGLLEEDNPRVIIPPHSLKSFTWHLGGIFEGHTIFLAVAIFADGKEEGDKDHLDGLKESRRRHQQRQRAQKGGPK